MTKPDEERPSRQTYVPAAVLPTGGLAEVPERPRHWWKDTVAGWDAFWASDMARFVMEIDVPVVVRLFNLRDQYLRVQHELKSMSGAQLIEDEATTLMQVAARVNREMMALEKPLGIGAANRARMNIKPAKGGGPSAPVAPRPEARASDLAEEL